MTEVLAFLGWWVAVTLTGWIAWPLVARFLGQLPDLGYSVSKPFGLLLGGYIFWLLSSFGFLRLDAGGVFVAAALLLIASLAASRGGGWTRMHAWVGDNRRVIVITEVVFLACFALWAYVRALNPEIVATEKPMEFAFLNSILRTKTMPPRDPWLAGYAISYYYFGYVVIALLTEITGVLPSVAFNLGIALLFGLTATGAFGIVLNMIALADVERARERLRPPLRPPRNRGGMGGRVRAAVWPALLGPLFVVFTGNLTGLLEVLHARGIGSAAFWAWLNLRDLDGPALLTASGLPDRYLWWWRASRVIRDVNLSNIPIGLEPIDEFPFFSFLLGDMHPHVLALPFVFLGIAIALQLFIAQSHGTKGERLTTPPPAPPPKSGGDGGGGRWLPLPALELLVYGLILGGLSFLNTWDFPIYVFVVVAAFAVARGRSRGWQRQVWLQAALLGAWLTVIGVVAYLPFYISFRSQASGVLPNPMFPTRLNQFVVMFGTSLLPLLAWLGWLLARARGRINWRVGLAGGPGVLLALASVCAVLTLAVAFSDLPQAHEAVRLVLGDMPLRVALPLVVRKRLIEAPWASLVLTGMLTVAAGFLFARHAARREPTDVISFALILVGTGALLTLGPEFVYLRDSFGMRMNTIFKFYYQTWVLWAVAAAFAAWHVSRHAGRAGGGVYAIGVSIVLAAGLVYPVLAVRTKSSGFEGTTVLPTGERIATLDGMAYMQSSRAADYEAIQWLNQDAGLRGVIAEAVGGSYTDYARVSAHTGLQTVLGWPGHELQWRGGFDEASGREEDIQALYSTLRWDEARSVLDKYNIRYVYVGPLERSQFPEQGLAKFAEHMQPIYDRDDVTVYERVDDTAS